MTPPAAKPSPPGSPDFLLPPARRLVFLLVFLLLGLGGVIYWLSLPFARSASAVRIPGMAGVQAAYLPRGEGAAGLTIDQVARLDKGGAFVQMPPPESVPVLNKGLGESGLGEERWYRLTFQNTSDDSRRAVLDLIWRIYDEVAIYRPLPNGSWDETLAGMCVSPRDPKRSPRWMAFELTFPPHQALTVYLHARDYYRLPVQFLFWSNPDDFLRWERFMYGQYIGYFCLWVGMVAYGLFLYAMLRERAQLHYVLFAILVGAMIPISSCLSTLFVQWTAIPVREMLFGALGSLALVNLCLFTRHFLDTPSEDPLLDRWLRRLQWVAWASLGTLPIALWPPYALNCLQAFGIMAVGILGALLGAAVRRWRSGSPYAPFFLLAFSPYLFGLMLWMFNARDVVARDDEQRLALLIGNALSLIFLSFTAAYRHRLALEKHRSLQTNYTDSLEREVAERTHGLQTLSDRLSVAMAERDRVITVIGHDLRGPAVSLASLMRLLTDEASSLTREEFTQLAREIEQTCDLQLELLNNLLVWGRTQSGAQQIEPAPFSVREAVSSVWRLLKGLVNTKQLELINAIPPSLIVHADTQLVQTVLRNLLVNAIKFSHPGGRVEVRATPLPEGLIQIRVQDEGVGIPAENLAALFSGAAKSTLGTQAEKGTGIGLNLCRDLAQAAGGDIRIESMPDCGTTVFFTLSAY